MLAVSCYVDMLCEFVELSVHPEEIIETIIRMHRDTINIFYLYSYEDSFA
jgi:hypothetical protein